MWLGSDLGYAALSPTRSGAAYRRRSYRRNPYIGPPGYR